MTKIRTLLELQERLDRESQWRLSELDYIKGPILKTDGVAQNSLIRASVVMQYAHWEGFVKASALYYLNFVSNQNVPYGQLRDCFSIHAVRKGFSELGVTGNFRSRVRIAVALRENFSVAERFYSDKLIETKSNLNSEVLQDILSAIGVDTAAYVSKFLLIDKDLLASRNSIAHGEYLAIDRESSLRLFQECRDLIVTLKNDILNAASTQSFKRPVSPPSEAES